MHTATQEIDSMIQAARHDHDALGELLMRFHALLTEVAAQKLHPAVSIKYDPADVASDTISAGLRGYKAFRGTTKGEFVAWLSIIHERTIWSLHHKYLSVKKNDIRREIPIYDRNRTTLVWLDVPNNDTSLTMREMRFDRASLLIDALLCLPERQREAVKLRHLRGWSLDAISAKLGCSDSAAAGYIKRGLRKLNRSLPPEARP
jgi:RNA polymerase sigma-70 factor (subfamily 1)